MLQHDATSQHVSAVVLQCGLSGALEWASVGGVQSIPPPAGPNVAVLLLASETALYLSVSVRMCMHKLYRFKNSR